MTNLKKFLYLLFFIMLFCSYLLYSIANEKVFDFNDAHSLYSWIQETQKKIIENKETMTAQLKNVSDILIRENSADLNVMLMKISEMGLNYCVVDKNGKVYNDDFNRLDITLGSKIRSDGYAFFENSSNQKVVAVPLGSDYYLVDIMNTDDYMKRITENIVLPNNYVGQYLNNSTYYLYTYDEANPIYASKSISDNYIGYSTKNLISFNLSDGDDNLTVLFNPPHIISQSPMLQIKSISLWTLVISFAVFILSLANDILYNRKNKILLEQMAITDNLTGLNNISALDKWYENVMPGNDEGYSFVCMDIVSFKKFNDIFGFKKGNSLLISIADTLKDRIGNAIRTYGDTFAFVVKDSDDDLDNIKDSLYDSVEKNLGVGYKNQVFFKFGIYPIQDREQSVWFIYDQAMLALKLAKKHPKLFEKIIYDSSTQQKIEQKKIIEENMYSALEEREFVLYIQPKCDLYTELCCGGEILVRWNSKKLGFVMPDQFISIFENNGFIAELDLYILESALKMQQGYYDSGKKLLPLSVNQSKITITSLGYLDRVNTMIQKYSFPLKYIEIEVTESALEDNFENILTIIKSMRESGFRVDMDDFGAGFSSLSNLRYLPIDILKIDRGFLKEYDDKSQKIVKSIINMTKALGITVLCEGVETENQYDLLKTSGCDYIQGYYYSKPMPAIDYENLYINTSLN